MVILFCYVSSSRSLAKRLQKVEISSLLSISKRCSAKIVPIVTTNDTFKPVVEIIMEANRTLTSNF